MGNVEIKDRARKPHSIFGQRQHPSSRSPLRNILANSPYRLSPIRYSPVTARQRPHTQNAIREDTSVLQSSIRDTRLPIEEAESRERGQENREKCEEIIRKVRNFNDFLVELKRKLREESGLGVGGVGVGRQRSEVSLSVKLENEKVELEKYKKLVERELSKTHSIENITIHQAQNGEKILTIQYEDQTAPITTLAPTPAPVDSLTLTDRLLEMARESEEREGAERRVKEARALWTVL
jgi:hypothetical protein